MLHYISSKPEKASSLLPCECEECGLLTRLLITKPGVTNVDPKVCKRDVHYVWHQRLGMTRRVPCLEEENWGSGAVIRAVCKPTAALATMQRSQALPHSEWWAIVSAATQSFPPSACQPTRLCCSTL